MIGKIRSIVSLRIQSECGKIRTRITPQMDTFCAVSWLRRFINSWVIVPGFPNDLLLSAKLIHVWCCKFCKSWIISERGYDFFTIIRFKIITTFSHSTSSISLQFHFCRIVTLELLLQPRCNFLNFLNVCRC